MIVRLSLPRRRFVKLDFWLSNEKKVLNIIRQNDVREIPVAEVTKISSVVLMSPDPSSQSSSSSQDGRSWIFSLCFGLNVVGNRVGATYTGVMISSGSRSDIIIKMNKRYHNRYRSKFITQSNYGNTW